MATTSTEHYVYLISDSDGHVKVGHTKDLKSRLSALGTAAPTKLSLEHSWARPTREAAMALEKALHRAFTWCRTAREWHAAEAREIRSIGDILIRGDEAAALGLVALIRSYREATTAYKSFRDAIDRLPPFTPAVERDALRNQMNEALDLHVSLYSQARAAGLVPSDLDIDLDESRRLRREAKAARAAGKRDKLQWNPTTRSYDRIWV